MSQDSSMTCDEPLTAVGVGSSAWLGDWPRLTHEEIFLAGWSAAITAAAAHIKGQALTPLEIADGTKWSDDATDYMAAKMQTELSGPNK